MDDQNQSQEAKATLRKAETAYPCNPNRIRVELSALTTPILVEAKQALDDQNLERHQALTWVLDLIDARYAELKDG